MQNTLKVWLLGSLMMLLHHVGYGEIIQSNQIDAVLPYVNAENVNTETWVIFDIDNTLIESSLNLGSAQWRKHIRAKALEIGYSEEESEEVLDKFWNFVQPFIPVRLVDGRATSVIAELQKSDIVTIALTAREPREEVHTQQQLESVNINFSKQRFNSQYNLPTYMPGLYQNGVIYSGFNLKSAALFGFFKAVGKTPKKVVFIDDDPNQVVEVGLLLQQQGIEYTGIRFGGADKRVQDFDPAIADVQWSQLPKLISDEEAKAMVSDKR